MNRESVAAVIVAGGIGKRLGLKKPKQFLNVRKAPMIIHSIKAFERNNDITSIVVVCHKDFIDYCKKTIKKYKIKKALQVIAGGKTRQESGYNGLAHCPEGTKYVLIHDAARPFVSDDLIERLIKETKKYGAVIPACKVKDTIIEEAKGYIKSFPERDKLMNVQTPQGFKYELIAIAHELAEMKKIKNATDDATLIANMGKRVKVIEGDTENIKITDKADLETANRSTE
ncbi:MAG: 2-C-methyl-D-erythritol 4-phosphate cytidylyltransferase [Candidatus Omnitrophica bacterium]|nr:2-C-methyl-D-erythritol 4-phosphate cytidylyltransferase [Candidatus Omnitrophota bacterium]